MQKRVTLLAMVLALLSPGLLWAEAAKPTDPQIAHIAYTAGLLDTLFLRSFSARASARSFKAKRDGQDRCIRPMSCLVVGQQVIVPKNTEHRPNELCLIVVTDLVAPQWLSSPIRS